MRQNAGTKGNANQPAACPSLPRISFAVDSRRFRCAAVLPTESTHGQWTTAKGQRRKIRACPLHVRFTPLSGLMLKLVSVSAMGQEQTFHEIQISTASLRLS
jgi:hypothetical protein